MQLIDGKAIAEKIHTEIAEKVRLLNTKPGLAVILVGNDPASRLYVSLKEKACARAGIHFEKHVFGADEPEQNLLAQISSLNIRPDIHGILVQLPLPPSYNTDKIIAAVNPKKDVDGFHPKNLKLLPVTTKAVATLLKSIGVALLNKNAVILANSQTFALPIKTYLENQGVKTKIIFYNPNLSISQSLNLSQTDILITAVGQPKIIKPEMIKDGAIVVDVGTNRVNCGTEDRPYWKTVGDVDAESLKQKTGFLTPVPGGVGPVTVAMLLENIFWLAQQS
ncbi:MAG: bifunctional 5,10-methylenetetrahydrofolate dehydrogenase/5,10-methenyltetrahydrofolate cyclohydrolase [bacterium]|nr:bifunctional 5,10-methylenetetrahydrofolate dehydrogenase/5,10-methenyltetrahydrofolate cyclohydrolase [bacterium]